MENQHAKRPEVPWVGIFFSYNGYNLVPRTFTLAWGKGPGNEVAMGREPPSRENLAMKSSYNQAFTLADPCEGKGCQKMY